VRSCEYGTAHFERIPEGNGNITPFSGKGNELPVLSL